MLKTNNYRTFAIILVLSIFTIISCKTVDTSPKPIPPSLKIEEIKVGSGAEAQYGNIVKVHYVGTLTNGTKFDSSRDKKRAFSFELGGGEVIEGWDLGLQGMRVGGIRKLTIPPDLGYGSEEKAKIPANSTLIFEIELLDVK